MGSFRFAVRTDDGYQQDYSRENPEKRLRGRGAWLGFLGMMAYLCYTVFVTIFGIGGEFGWGDNARITPGITTIFNKKRIAWGAHLVHLRAGQTVQVRYDADVSLGELKAQIYSRYRLRGPDAWSPPITGSGKGTVYVVAPADGWYAVRMRSKSTLSKEELSNQPLVGPRATSTESSYSMVWRVVS
jgi:hypothetical protein